MAPSPLSPLTILSNMDGFSPVAVHDIHLAKRADRGINPADGAKDPRAYNNLWFQLLFAFIGIGMTMTALWFFFRAKNGGFKWQENDWEDYKSTVLRRKGPDGRTLSNATKSTKLGGGSVVHGGTYGAPTTVGYTDETGTTVSEMREVEEGKSRRHFGIRGGDADKKKKKRHEHDNDYKDPDLRDYRDERPAKVGGLNRQADGMYTDYSATGTEPSDLGSNVSGRPLVKDKAKKSEKDQKKEDKAKKQRAIERMRKAKLAEKEAAKTAAAEAKAAKEAEKQAAKEKKAEQKKAKKAKSEVAPSEIGGPAMTEYTALESEYTYDAPKTEYTAPSEAPAPARGSSRRAPPSAAYSFVTGDDRTEYTGAYTDISHDNNTKSRAAPAPTSAPSEAQESSYYSDYRPNAERTRASRSQSRPRQHESRSRPSSQSPRKHHRASTSRPGPSNASDIFTAANGDVRGTIAYPCHIPGLSTAGSVAPNDSVSQMGAPRGPRREERGGRDVMAGYRRGGVRTVRRDSLSDSDS
ncbi:uncharacterized protein CC84DRAFT_1166942 [Paraphaeosphaeria sporulosa]|uniref:Uncharacterized protein n=1 Tax=Paraphaeosphaeria sporulosa TaxID=1460663 RepID=A0A177C720_9PLEO|nr:uncharacterized protein CC84DRAFT_1166942 [Paraphaeosphaeria sporulosa]OAG03206.1 hypothetical protein CC84DRAFT_1166942 [Paraphaeosphaeria sporulosa]